MSSVRLINKPVEIFTYTDEKKLRDEILNAFKYGYKLVGPVQVGTNNHGRFVYVATLIHKEVM